MKHKHTSTNRQGCDESAQPWWTLIASPVGPSKSRSYRVHVAFYLISYSFFVLIGLEVPNNILSTSPTLSSLTDAVALVIPQIDAVTQLGLRPEVNRFHYTVLWIASPVYVILQVVQTKGGYNSPKESRNFLALGFVCGMIAVLYGLSPWHHGLIVPQPYDRMALLWFGPDSFGGVLCASTRRSRCVWSYYRLERA